MSTPFRIATDAPGLDIGLLHYRDRAVLRILDRAEAATAASSRSSSTVTSGSPSGGCSASGRPASSSARSWPTPSAAAPSSRTAASAGGGVAEPAAGAGRSGENRLGHTLDVVDTVCALVSASDDPRHHSPVWLWLDEPNAAAVLGTPPYPDGVVALQSDGRSAVICLEIDEATQRRAVIEAKLNGYRRLLDAYPTWWLLFVVPSRTRARWLRSVAGQADERVVARAWVTSLTALQLRHLDAPVRALADGRTATVRELADTTDGCRTSAPVGSEEWLRLLGEGGVEELDGILWYVAQATPTSRPPRSRTAPASGSSPPPVMSRRKGRCPSRSTFPNAGHRAMKQHGIGVGYRYRHEYEDGTSPSNIWPASWRSGATTSRPTRATRRRSRPARRPGPWAGPPRKARAGRRPTRTRRRRSAERPDAGTRDEPLEAGRDPEARRERRLGVTRSEPEAADDLHVGDAGVNSPTG